MSFQTKGGIQVIKILHFGIAIDRSMMAKQFVAGERNFISSKKPERHPDDLIIYGLGSGLKFTKQNLWFCQLLKFADLNIAKPDWKSMILKTNISFFCNTFCKSGEVFELAFGNQCIPLRCP